MDRKWIALRYWPFFHGLAQQFAHMPMPNNNSGHLLDTALWEFPSDSWQDTRKQAWHHIQNDEECIMPLFLAICFWMLCYCVNWAQKLCLQKKLRTDFCTWKLIKINIGLEWHLGEFSIGKFALPGNALQNVNANSLQEGSKPNNVILDLQKNLHWDVLN